MVWAACNSGVGCRRTPKGLDRTGGRHREGRGEARLQASDRRSSARSDQKETRTPREALVSMPPSAPRLLSARAIVTCSTIGHCWYFYLPTLLGQVAALEQQLKLDKMTHVQKAAIPHLLAGSDVCTHARTRARMGAHTHAWHSRAHACARVRTRLRTPPAHPPMGTRARTSSFAARLAACLAYTDDPKKKRLK